ncbi:hypothetical protein BGY98DRAFT_938225 [Russula aff. rugulosa BPL654]|nr:hypothetical protein BGY98DRAFT_938225 [Russula aff. rugulosa BPL654]
MKRILHKEVEAKDQQAADLNNQGERLIRQLGEQLIQELSTTAEETPEVPADVPSDVAHTTDDDDSFSTRSSGWDEDHDEEYKTLWPTPPTTPPQGDDMHPPQIQISGPYPGQGWVLNTYGTTHYYRFLIPDPTTRRNVVAPYLSYSINRSKPEVSGTYGEGYPVYTRPLTAANVDYICPVYQYYRETQYAIQASIKSLREKEMRYMEQAIGTLSELENANILGRLLAHDGDVVKEALPDPPSIRASCNATRSPGAFISLPLDADKRLKEEKEDKKDLDELEQTLRDHLHTRDAKTTSMSPPTSPCISTRASAAIAATNGATSGPPAPTVPTGVRPQGRPPGLLLHADCSFL